MKEKPLILRKLNERMPTMMRQAQDEAMNLDAILSRLSISEYCAAAHGTRREIILYIMDAIQMADWWQFICLLNSSDDVQVARITPLTLRFGKSLRNLKLECLDLAETGRSTPCTTTRLYEEITHMNYCNLFFPSSATLPLLFTAGADRRICLFVHTS